MDEHYAYRASTHLGDYYTPIYNCTIYAAEDAKDTYPAVSLEFFRDKNYLDPEDPALLNEQMFSQELQDVPYQDVYVLDHVAEGDCLEFVRILLKNYNKLVVSSFLVYNGPYPFSRWQNTGY
jgi:hypothetical protein